MDLSVHSKWRGGHSGTQPEGSKGVALHRAGRISGTVKSRSGGGGGGRGEGGGKEKKVPS